MKGSVLIILLRARDLVCAVFASMYLLLAQVVSFVVLVILGNINLQGKKWFKDQNHFKERLIKKDFPRYIISDATLSDLYCMRIFSFPVSQYRHQYLLIPT